MAHVYYYYFLWRSLVDSNIENSKEGFYQIWKKEMEIKADRHSSKNSCARLKSWERIEGEDND